MVFPLNILAYIWFRALCPVSNRNSHAKKKFQTYSVRFILVGVASGMSHFFRTLDGLVVLLGEVETTRSGVELTTVHSHKF